MLQTILAPNPSPLTGPGTNTFLLGRDGIAVIDPGPAIDSHIAAILAAGAGRITHILVTHVERKRAQVGAKIKYNTNRETVVKKGGPNNNMNILNLKSDVIA